jgi:hypothetical protein
MAQQFLVQIRSQENKAMSGFKPASPKMINAMKELSIIYEGWFGQKFTVHRFITTPKGLKRV